MGGMQHFVTVLVAYAVIQSFKGYFKTILLIAFFFLPICMLIDSSEQIVYPSFKH